MGRSFFDKTTMDVSYKFIQVGGNPFHALAVAFIDHFKSTGYVANAAVKKIYECFNLLYPNYITYHAVQTKPSERLKMLVNSSRRSEVVGCMANVFEEIIWDEIKANLSNYRDTLEHIDNNISIDHIRTSKYFNTILRRALDSALGITLVLSILEPGKEIRQLVHYQTEPSATSKIELSLQVQGKFYFPKVKYAADYPDVGHLAIKLPVPQTNHQPTDSIEQQITMINRDNQRLLGVYKQWRQNLLTMTQANELTLANLIDLYIKFLPLKKESCVSNPTEFFSKLTKECYFPLPLHCSDYRVRQLVSALASWISLELIDADLLLEDINPSAPIHSKCS